MAKSKLRKALYAAYRHFMLKFFRSKMVEHDWLQWKGYPIDWDNPRDLNEKIQWLMCKSDTSLWSKYSDKVAVNEFIKSKGYGDALIPVLGVWDKAEDIDFDSLPEKFVLKCNHDSGSTMILDKSKGIDEAAVRKFYAKQLKVKYGYVHGEMYYNDIEPKIMAEAIIEQGGEPPFDTLIDYKFWCFDGKPYSVLVCFDRHSDNMCLNIYDLDWNVHPECSVFSDHYRNGNVTLPKPACFDKMLEVAADLSKGFPEVGVDLYAIGDKFYFGELTFARLCGKIDYLTDDYLQELGRQCVLPKK